MKELIFTLSEFESIKIITKNNIDFDKIDRCCSELQVYFINEQEQLQIGKDSAGELFEHFITYCKKSIDQKLQLHESLTKNLGFMENEYYHEFPHNKPEFFMISSPSGQSTYWIGSNYEMWSVSGNANKYVNTWLYNNHDHQIILEITPLYKWSFNEREPEDSDFITYDEFMKDYKPLIHRVIPRDVAIIWLDQAMKVYRGFFSSEEDYIRACKENNW